MTGRWWLDVLISVVASLAVVWVVLIATLAAVRPRGGLLREALRLLPDVIRLVHNLATASTVPRGTRLRLGLLLAYLASPIDLVPDFIPVLGYADDAIVVTLVLRGVVRRAGLDVVRTNWPGSDDGFTVLCRLTGIEKR